MKISLLPFAGAGTTQAALRELAMSDAARLSSAWRAIAGLPLRAYASRSRITTSLSATDAVTGTRDNGHPKFALPSSCTRRATRHFSTATTPRSCLLRGHCRQAHASMTRPRRDAWRRINTSSTSLSCVCSVEVGAAGTLPLSREAVAQSRPTASAPKGDLVRGILTASDERLKQIARRKRASTKHERFVRQPQADAEAAASAAAADEFATRPRPSRRRATFTAAASSAQSPWSASNAIEVFPLPL
jgi:hypothetical protein